MKQVTPFIQITASSEVPANARTFEKLRTLTMANHAKNNLRIQVLADQVAELTEAVNLLLSVIDVENQKAVASSPRTKG